MPPTIIRCRTASAANPEASVDKQRLAALGASLLFTKSGSAVTDGHGIETQGAEEASQCFGIWTTGAVLNHVVDMRGVFVSF